MRSEFSKIRTVLFPIHKEELKFFIPMVVMLFSFLFNYTIMRDTKDTLILSQAGAEVIPFLKFWGTLPVCIVFFLVYSKLANVLKPTTLFYVIVLPFLFFFGAFGFVLYPYRELLQPNGLADRFQEFILVNFPKNMHHTLLMLNAVFRNWIYAVFYVLSELWGSMGVSLLFWQLANQLFSTDQAKRFYPRFIQFGNLSLIASGFAIIYFSDIRKLVGEGVDAWGLTLKWLMLTIVFFCLLIMGSYYIVSRQFESKVTVQREKTKLSIWASLSYLAQNRYLLCIALLVLCYGISINIMDVLYKSQLKRQFLNENDLCAFTGVVSIFTGLTTFLMVMLSANVLRFLGWFVAAVATPLLILVTSLLFFGCVSFDQQLSNFLPFTPIWIAVVTGAAQNILNKSAKYSLFDPSKELAYIPLDQEAKVKGKAAIDVVGARFGKSAGGIILQVVFLFGAIMDNLPLLFGILTLVISLWVGAVSTLNRQYQEKVVSIS